MSVQVDLDLSRNSSDIVEILEKKKQNNTKNILLQDPHTQFEPHFENCNTFLSKKQVHVLVRLNLRGFLAL